MNFGRGRQEFEIGNLEDCDSDVDCDFNVYWGGLRSGELRFSIGTYLFFQPSFHSIPFGCAYFSPYFVYQVIGWCKIHFSHTLLIFIVKIFFSQCFCFGNFSCRCFLCFLDHTMCYQHKCTPFIIPKSKKPETYSIKQCTQLPYKRTFQLFKEFLIHYPTLNFSNIIHDLSLSLKWLITDKSFCFIA